MLAMKMALLNKELFDGQEEEWIKYEGDIIVEGNKIHLRFKDFSDNEFHLLNNYLNYKDVDYIVEQLKLRPTTLGNKVYYKDDTRLSVVYCEKEVNNQSCLVILSIGESQPKSTIRVV